MGVTNGGTWVHNADCTAAARGLLFKKNDGWVVRAEPTSGSNLGIRDWAYHDAYIDSEGAITDVTRGLGPMSVDEWRNTFPHPDYTSIRYPFPDELFGARYRGTTR